MMKSRPLLATIVLAVTACSPGTAGLPLATQGSAQAVVPQAGRTRLAHASLRLVVPHRQHRRRGHYVSASTQSIAVTFTPAVGSTVHFAAGLAPGSPGCQNNANANVCTLSIALAPGTYTANFTTYDGPLSSGAPTGNVLSSNQTVPVTVKLGLSNALSVTLDGVPASIVFVPGSATQMPGTTATGFSLSKCASAQTMYVVVEDAAGNEILGAGAPALGLQSSDTAHLAVTAAQHPGNAFMLSRPAIPNAQSIVTLTATATPLAGSGASSIHQTANVKFNSDICGVVTEFPSKGSGPGAITAGPDGNLWFVELADNGIGHISTDGVVGTEYTLCCIQPYSITAGSDGSLWLPDFSSSQIFRLTTSGGWSQWMTTTANARPYGVTLGPDGNVWFTEQGVDKVGRITTNGAISEFNLTSGALPYGIITGPDGALWFSEQGTKSIGRMTTAGTLTNEIPLADGDKPRSIAAGGDGKLWFVECNPTASTLLAGSMTISIAPTFSAYNVPSNNPDLVGTVAGPDGAIYITEFLTGSIARISDGPPLTISEYKLPNPSSQPIGITVGPDGALWFTERGNNEIGRLQ